MQQDTPKVAPDTGQTGEVSVLDELRRRKKQRKLRRFAAIVVAVALALSWITGLLATSLTAAADLFENIRIAAMREDGYPAQTGISEVYQAVPMQSGYVALGSESCLVFTEGGTRLRSLQPGYARPAIAVGDTRFVMYNRGGTELRVEGRTKTLFTKNTGSSILLCAMAKNGSLAVVTEDPRYLATLQICSASMEQQLSWNMTDAEGVPLRLAFSPDGKKLAVATLLAENGQAKSNLYLLDSRKNTETLLTSTEQTVPLAVQWMPDGSILVLYDTCAAVFSAADGAEKARYSYDGYTPAAWSFCAGKTALVLSSANSALLVLLDEALTPLAETQTALANSVTLTKTAVYTTTDTAVECYSLEGEYQAKRTYDTRPQAVIEAKSLLVFTDSTVAVCDIPQKAGTGSHKQK
jgi:hypothetical protein